MLSLAAPCKLNELVPIPESKKLGNNAWFSAPKVLHSAQHLHDLFIAADQMRFMSSIKRLNDGGDCRGIRSSENCVWLGAPDSTDDVRIARNTVRFAEVSKHLRCCRRYRITKSE